MEFLRQLGAGPWVLGAGVLGAGHWGLSAAKGTGYCGCGWGLAATSCTQSSGCWAQVRGAGLEIAVWVPEDSEDCQDLDDREDSNSQDCEDSEDSED